MRKLALILSIFLIFSVTVGATELGLEQAWDGKTNLRLDASYAVFSIPLSNSIQSFEVGLKVPTTLADSYLVGKVNLTGSENYDWQFEKFKAGVGYPLELGNWSIRGEFVAISPEWSEIADWEFQPSLTFGFNFNLLETTE